MVERNLGRSIFAVAGAVLAAAWLLAPAFAAAEDAKLAKEAVKAPIGFDDAQLRGDLPAGAPFIDPDTILKGKSSPREAVLFRGEELVVDVYADDEVKIRMDEPFPHDEFIYILSGELRVTDEAGVERKYAAGDFLMIPKGLKGIWHHSENFRELVVIERKVFDASYPSE